MNPMGRKGKPLTVGPHNFDSVLECARFFDRSTTNVRYHRDQGTLDSLLEIDGKRHDGLEVPVPIRGVLFASEQDAATHFGVTVSAISHARRRGTLDTIGSKELFK
jgi:hypothetical protein